MDSSHTDHCCVIVWSIFFPAWALKTIIGFPCRDEFNRLVGILNSNAVPDVEREKERPSLTAEEGAKPKDLLSPEYARTPVEGKKDVSKIVSGISSAHIETNVGLTFSITCLYVLNLSLPFFLYYFFLPEVPDYTQSFTSLSDMAVKFFEMSNLYYVQL